MKDKNLKGCPYCALPPIMEAVPVPNGSGVRVRCLRCGRRTKVYKVQPDDGETMFISAADRARHEWNEMVNVVN